MEFTVNKKTPKCTTVVNTASGEFTFHSEVMSRCEAKKFCKKEGGILAPVTNREDLNALKEAAYNKNKDCPFHYGVHQYNVGLDITPCGYKKQDRWFTNGVKWDKKIHGPLYEETDTSLVYPCTYAGFFPYTGDNGDMIIALRGDNCDEVPFRFICLKPAPKSTEGYVDRPFSVMMNHLVGDSSTPAVNYVTVGMFATVLVLMCVALASFMRYKSASKEYEQAKERGDVKEEI